MPARFTKDPDAVLNYRMDWTDWLAGTDTILASEWTASGVTIDSSSFTQTTADCVVSGGVAGTTGSISNKITTAGGLVDERTIQLQIRER